MNEQSESLKELLLQTDEQFHRLATQHHDLDHRLSQLAAKHYKSEPEHFEEITLKKQKLHVKDQMEDILRRRRGDAHDARG